MGKGFTLRTERARGLDKRSQGDVHGPIGDKREWWGITHEGQKSAVKNMR